MRKIVNLSKEKIVKKYSDLRTNRMQFEKSYVHPLWGKSKNVSTESTYTNATIKTLLRSPYTNYAKLQEISNYFWANSPTYQNFIYYFATLLTFDYALSPTMLDKESVMKKRLMSSAYFVKSTNVRTQFASMMIRTLLNGETYWYDMSSNKDKSMMEEIPSKYCQLAYIDDKTGLWRYYVDLDKINSTVIDELPNEIVNAYNAYANVGKADKKKKKKDINLDIEIPSNLYLVSENSFAIFVHKEKNQHDYPFLASMFVDINTYEYNKAYMDEYLKESNIKLVHFKIPSDEDGNPLFDKDIVDIYHESAKELLPNSTYPLTNPFEVQSLNFDTVQDSALGVTKNAKEQVQFGGGVSSTLFDSSTTNGLLYSVETDAQKMYPLLSFFNNWMNFKLDKNKFSVSFLEIHRHNRLDWHKQYSTDLQNGGQRQLFLATNGIDLYDSLMISEMEKLLDVDSLLVSKLNGAQSSASDLGGRPELDSKNKTASTEKGQEYK